MSVASRVPHQLAVLFVVFCASTSALGTSSIDLIDATAVAVEKQEEVRSAIPLGFEENRGQINESVRFYSRSAAFDTFFTDEGLTVLLKPADKQPSVIQIRFASGRIGVKPVALQLQNRVTNYFTGLDSSQYVVNVKNFSRVKYESVYPGIDVAFYGAQGQLEYDLIIAPKADPHAAKLTFRGVEHIALADDGNLVLDTRSGPIEFGRPVAYQEISGRRREVRAHYELTSKDQVGFQLGKYDPDYALVIDPLLTMATNVWGGTTTGVALDSAKNIYITGTIWTTDLPASAGYQTSLAGTNDAYVTKLNASGTSVIWSTYLGVRRATTNGLGIAVDSSGSAYVTGTTTSTTGFPHTPNAYQSSGSTFVTKFNASGNALLYSTYVSAPVAAMAVDGSGNAFMAGTATALITTPGAYQPTRIGPSSSYVAKLNATGTQMLYATYVGGSANDDGKGVAVDASGNAYVVGVARSVDFPIRSAFHTNLQGPTDAFVTKVNSTGTGLVYSTYLGGSGDERGLGIAVDSGGEALVTGWTKSSDFPVTPGVFQPSIGYPTVSNGFISKLSATGDSLVYSSYLGGGWCPTSCFGIFDPDEGIDSGVSVAVDAAGYAYIGGYATSYNFPLVDSMIPTMYETDQWHKPLVAKVTPGGDALVYASGLGTASTDLGVTQIVADGGGGAVAVGMNTFAGFPLTAGAVLGSGSGFVFKVNSGIYPTIVRSSINPARRDQPVTLIAVVQNPSSGAVVTFKDGATVLGTASPANGSAAVTVSLAPGVHRITATNSADSLLSPPYFQLVSGQQ